MTAWVATKRESPVLVFSQHAERRVHQRGLRPDDVQVVLAYGEWVEDGCLLSDRAASRARVLLRKTEDRSVLQRLDHLRNVTVVVAGTTIVTVYRADSRRIRRLREGPVKSRPRAA